MSQEKTDIVVAQPQGMEVIGSADLMREKLDASSKRFQIVHEFVDDNFRKGIDFGSADGTRNPKPTLLKPGAERICKLFNTRPTWRKDSDTWEMLGEPKGTVCYICEIVDNTTGAIVGEGRGAEKMGNKQRDANKAIKIAEKCALVDAALYTFGLSELFTQDGGASKVTLDDKKAELSEWVDEIRTGCNSSMTGNRFIHAVIQDHLKKSAIQTEGELNAVRGAIEQGVYDLETGERIPD